MAGEDRFRCCGRDGCFGGLPDGHAGRAEGRWSAGVEVSGKCGVDLEKLQLQSGCLPLSRKLRLVTFPVSCPCCTVFYRDIAFPTILTGPVLALPPITKYLAKYSLIFNPEGTKLLCELRD